MRAECDLTRPARKRCARGFLVGASRRVRRCTAEAIGHVGLRDPARVSDAISTVLERPAMRALLTDAARAKRAEWIVTKPVPIAPPRTAEEAAQYDAAIDALAFPDRRSLRSYLQCAIVLASWAGADADVAKQPRCAWPMAATKKNKRSTAPSSAPLRASAGTLAPRRMRAGALQACVLTR